MSNTGKPIVLILCTGNSCRSQMAEGFLRHYQPEKYDPHSAGMKPSPEVHPLAIKVMSETGIDISHQRPKSVNAYLGKAPVKHLLIVCDNAHGTCPRIWPGTYSRTFMPFDDPAAFEGSDEQKLAEFRRVRDLIGHAMKTWEPQVDRAGR